MSSEASRDLKPDPGHPRRARPRPGRVADDADLRDHDLPVRQRRRGLAYNEGRSDKYPLLALRQSHGRCRRSARSPASTAAETALLFSTGHGGRRPRRSLGLPACRRRGAVCRSRSTVGRCTCCTTCCRGSGSRHASSRSNELAALGVGAIGERPASCGSSRRSIRRCAASTSRRSPRPAGRAACSRSSTTPLPRRSTSSRWRSASISSMQSATKYLNGHSDVTAGVVSGPRRLLEPIERARRLLGTVLDPYAGLRAGPRAEDAGGAGRAPQRQRAGGGARASRATRASATCTTRASRHTPTTRLAARQMRGFGGMVCIDLGGDYERAAAPSIGCGVIKRAASLGGVESLSACRC